MRVFCIGNGVTKFRPPVKQASHEQDTTSAASSSILAEAAAAGQAALSEAAVSFDEVDAAVCGYVYADSTAGQAATYRLGLTGIPIYNVNNNCATGSTSLSLARALVASGQHHCVLVLGFEEVDSDGLKETYPQHDVFGKHFETLQAIGVKRGSSMGMNIAAAYSAAASQRIAKHETAQEHFATITLKNRVHGLENPNALLFNTPTPSPEEVLAAPKLGKRSPLTFAMLAPLACGAAAALLVSENFVRKHSRAIDTVEVVELVGQALCTDTSASFDSTNTSSCLANIVGFDISRRAADAAYAQARLRPEDVDVVEVHDAFASNELAMYEALRLCADDEGGILVDSGNWRDTGHGSKLFHYSRPGGGSYVVNPSGGLMSRGHPIGATGLAQCAELCWQLRGVARKRQVNGAAVGLQHNYGWASAAVVTCYRRVKLALSESKL